MTLLLVLPPAIAAGADLARRIEWARRRFFGAELVLAADRTVASQYTQILGVEIRDYVPELTAGGLGAVVLMRGGGDRDCAVPPTAFDGRLYVQQRDGRIALQRQPFDDEEIDGVGEHVFSRMAPRRDAGYYYFPYGYFAHYPGMGPVDSFGFRGSSDWQRLATRDPSHRLVVVSGGSAVWSQCCLPEEAFPAVLEDLLNEWSRDSGLALRFSVMNLGIFGNLIVQQTFNYLLFAESLRPEYVIAHDGFSDFVFGLVSDPWLLAKHAMTYQTECEDWGQRIHNAPDELRTHRTIPFEVLNLPHVVVQAYVARKHQFRRVVQGGGARFIWGFQPCIFSKGELSPDEHRVVASPHPVYGPAHRKLQFVYDRFRALSRLPADPPIVDCHLAFRKCGANERLFHDHVHTTPLGDQKIARLYFEAIRQDFLSGALTSAPASADPTHS